MAITPKENYFMLLRGEIPEYIPSFMEPRMNMISEDLLTPVSAPDGPVYTGWGVKYVGSADIRNGAMPEPGFILLDDITKWRDVIKRPSMDRDWEQYYKKQLDTFDRENKAVACGGADYFLTLVSFMGFENTLMALYEEPEEVHALLDYVSDFYVDMMKRELYYCKPEIYSIMDDDAAYRAPFFSVEMYQEFFKPCHKKHTDLCNDNGIYITRHDCGKSEQFIDDWLELGIREWNPAQVSNDLKTIKKKYLGRLALSGCWDNQGAMGRPDTPNDQFIDAMQEYVDTFAPGGGFTFCALVEGDHDDPNTKEKFEIINKFYEENVRNYYKTHH